jgi:hypothetical protein
MRESLLEAREIDAHQKDEKNSNRQEQNSLKVPQAPQNKDRVAKTT